MFFRGEERGLAVAGTLSKAGQAAAKQAAEDFLKKYKSRVKSQGVKVLKGVGPSEGKALNFFKGRKRTSAYKPKAYNAKRGCQTASICLHPHIEWKDVELGGSKTLSNVPGALVDIGAVFPGERFISGHMINADFGGDHTNPGNQSILTHAANSQHDFDDAVKAAAKRMGLAMFEMYRASTDSGADSYLDGVYDEWVIEVQATVGAQSWYDVYKPNPAFNKNAAVKNRYPLDAVATKIVFTAAVTGTPTAGEIAKNLKIPSEKMGLVAAALAQFQQFMDSVTTFELTQDPPQGFSATDRSKVKSKRTTADGDEVTKTSTTKPYKPKVKGVKTVKPTVVSTPCCLRWSGGDIALQPGKDNVIARRTAKFPWAKGKSRLNQDFEFFITTDHSGGSAVVMLEDAGGSKIMVNGKRLGHGKGFLQSGEELLVYDSYAPNGEYYEFTYVQ